MPLSQELMLTNVLKHDEKKFSNQHLKGSNVDFKYRMLGGLGPNVGTQDWNTRMALAQRTKSTGHQNELINNSIIQHRI